MQPLMFTFELVTNLYKGCTLERYNTSDAYNNPTHRITSNTANTLTITPSASVAWR